MFVDEEPNISGYVFCWVICFIPVFEIFTHCTEGLLSVGAVKQSPSYADAGVTEPPPELLPPRVNVMPMIKRELEPITTFSPFRVLPLKEPVKRRTGTKPPPTQCVANFKNLRRDI